MRVTLALFGAYRRFHDGDSIELACPEGGRVADLRRALGEYAAAHWPGFDPALLGRTALASEEAVLRDGDPVPADGRVAILPPVSGG